MSDTHQSLLNAAESAIRLKGFHAVSFRDLADELGIKSSSVHYYFPQKQDLGLALVERYSKNFFNSVEASADGKTDFPERLSAYCDVYKSTLQQTNRICLCGILGAESAGLPDDLAKAVSQFFDANIKWLIAAQPEQTGPDKKRETATHIVATLQGAMMMANTLKDHSVFDRAVADLLQK